ncbi:carbohydrate ABC transporter permease [Vallitalea pronyensis]|uniref:Carbohydrate ABC transporter permease n=1 Tax=Vallitalea pronyensis TaxID=1348613 RepID=A0A8J8SHS9_9FIRM|nr:carbohydrate ABC transporter permease [Vallitalea pronyensis]QUI23742.1 carbohydrate ABC transporter permease [Vallitalea pronyensis]
MQTNTINQEKKNKERTKKNKLGKKRKEQFQLILTYIILTAWVVVVLIPVIFVILTAFKTDQEISLINFRWLPKSFTNIEAFRQAMQMGNWSRYFANSLFVTTIVVGGSLLFNSIGGFAFARLKFKGRDILFVMILTGLMISPQSVIIPQYMIMRMVPLVGGNNILGQGGTGLLDTYWSLIVPFMAGSFGVFLCKQFYSTFPRSLDDAAKIDGCGPIKTYVYIYVPLSKTILATLTIFKTVATWNDFFYPLIFTTSEKMKTVQLGLQMFKGSAATHYNWLMAATLISVIPTIIVYIFAQKYFVQGVVSSGMKN